MTQSLLFRFVLPSAILICIVLYGCRPEFQGPPFLNPDLPVDVRVDDLVGRMTLEEKVSQTMNNAQAIERLDIPAYEWWNEALHGVALNSVELRIWISFGFGKALPRVMPKLSILMILTNS